ncbi:PaaX family transcriptional regulator C-terminal domain-containing protein [Roseibium marinum]|uniref:Phenylacetic acid degradation operon negative regulatory protein n=1 Tax=Roseibium marinum TaxID=281252 RepID=A0A2S3UNY0_9HYPH|nr:PaaX family transcriptional regulator C-terminal domain-containing protein [Roseibium marinum]POF29406.1 phenylacetic acid degradation operon negative regulatory protein [Roseibium marinum]
MPACADLNTENYLKPFPPKAARLIVTIYGDIVEPRGGVLWMGDLINLCAGFGVNESLVRTAVSRLVSTGQLKGEREGRRSYYALTAQARDEYHLAAELFFGPADGECGWIVTHCSDESRQSGLISHGFVPVGGDFYIAAERPGRPVYGAAFRSTALQPEAKEMRALLTSAFDLGTLSRAYSGFVSQFRPMTHVLKENFDGHSALLLRLALVHAYREIRLNDPRLPPSVLPRDWPGFDAHRLFAELYIGLSTPADDYIGRHLFNRNGPLPQKPDDVKARLISLAARIDRPLSL